jgi:hypothetical protein
MVKSNRIVFYLIHLYKNLKDLYNYMSKSAREMCAICQQETGEDDNMKTAYGVVYHYVCVSKAPQLIREETGCKIKKNRLCQEVLNRNSINRYISELSFRDLKKALKRRLLYTRGYMRDTLESRLREDMIKFNIIKF